MPLVSAVCDDLRLGGTLDDETGISGGMTINGTALAVEDWSNLFGHAGLSYTPVEVSGRPGGFVVGDGLGLARYPILNLRFKTQGECDALELPADQLLENTDEFLALLTSAQGQYLEVDLPDSTSRFIHVTALTPALYSQPGHTRRITVPLYCPEPYWTEGGINHVEAVSGVDSFAVGGNVHVYNASINFAGNGTFVHLDNDWAITIAGAGAGTIHVNMGPRTITQSGDHVDQVMTPTNRLWGWFTPGTNNVQSDVATSVSIRYQWA
jgi:phage-related protein